MFSVEPLASVNTPPAEARLQVNAPKAKVPAKTDRSPATVSVAASVFVPEPEIVKLPYVAAPANAGTLCVVPP